MKATVMIALALGACDLEYDPDVGPLPAPDANEPMGVETDAGATGTPSTRCSDSDPMTAVTFSGHILPLFARSPSCNGCHGASATSGFSVLTYESLQRGGQISGVEIIVPGKPCESLLLQKLGPAPPFGTRMPYNGPPFFSTAELTLVRDWIAEGALDN
jgi:hypothetical protein